MSPPTNDNAGFGAGAEVVRGKATGRKRNTGPLKLNIGQGVAQLVAGMAAEAEHKEPERGSPSSSPQNAPVDCRASAALIISMHERAQRSAHDALESAKACGDLLIEAKAALRHGGWGSWLAKNVPFTERTAQRYMHLAENWGLIKTDTVSDLGLRGAMALISSRSNKKPVQEIRRVNVQRVNVEALRNDFRRQEEEKQALHKLCLQIIDTGYKIWAAKLHPDKGGTAQQMAMLNNARLILKKAI